MRRLAILLGLAIAACSGSSDEDGPDRSGVDASTSTDGGGRGGREADAGETPGDVALGADATDQGDDATTDTAAILDTRPQPPRDTGTDVQGRVEDECAQVTAVGDPVFAPVDIIWAIDTSGSMDQETSLIVTKLNEFVEFIEESGLDVRVVLVAADTVCIPAPLAGGGCPDTESDRYRHVRQVVNSSDALERLVASYALYSDFLRPEAVKHFVVVSDDESARSARWFRDEMAARGLPLFVFHSIVSLEETEECPLPGFCVPQGCSGPHGSAEAAGDIYVLLSEMTDGTASSICEPDWTPIFDGIATNVVANAALPCQYAIPDLGGGLEIVYSRVDVAINGVFLSHHDSSEGCLSAPGWYYDDNGSPTEIHICPGFCGAGFDGDEVVIEFGCVKS